MAQLHGCVRVGRGRRHFTRDTPNRPPGRAPSAPGAGRTARMRFSPEAPLWFLRQRHSHSPVPASPPALARHLSLSLVAQAPGGRRVSGVQASGRSAVWGRPLALCLGKASSHRNVAAVGSALRGVERLWRACLRSAPCQAGTPGQAGRGSDPESVRPKSREPPWGTKRRWAWKQNWAASPVGAA